MINLKVTTHSGEEDLVEVESYNPTEMVEQLNNNDLQAMAIGRNVYSRIDVKNIKPIE